MCNIFISHKWEYSDVLLDFYIVGVGLMCPQRARVDNIYNVATKIRICSKCKKMEYNSGSGLIYPGKEEYLPLSKESFLQNKVKRNRDNKLNELFE